MGVGDLSGGGCVYVLGGSISHLSFYLQQPATEPDTMGGQSVDVMEWHEHIPV